MSDPTRPSRAPAQPGECFGDWQCHTAASVIEVADKCVFKWATIKIFKRAKKTKLAKAGEIGVHCHSEAEKARKGQITVSDLSTLARVAYDAVPSGQWEAEKHIDHQDVGLPWKLFGKRDLIDQRRHRIWDYKFSSDPVKWMPGDPASDHVEPPPGPRPVDWEPVKRLSADTQMVLYSWAHLQLTGVIPEIGHVQTNVNTGVSRRVWTRIPPVELVRQWLRIRDVVLRMHRASQQKPEEIETCGYPGRGPACWAFNKRCEAYDFCLETERDRPRSQTSKWEV